MKTDRRLNPFTTLLIALGFVGNFLAGSASAQQDDGPTAEETVKWLNSKQLGKETTLLYKNSETSVLTSWSFSFNEDGILTAEETVRQNGRTTKDRFEIPVSMIKEIKSSTRASQIRKKGSYIFNEESISEIVISVDRKCILLQASFDEKPESHMIDWCTIRFKNSPELAQRVINALQHLVDLEKSEEPF